jgi:hypothetical protein
MVKNLAISALFLLGLSTFNYSQVVVNCPGGDTYKCTVETKPDGGTVTTFKGEGEVVVSIPKQ